MQILLMSFRLFVTSYNQVILDLSNGPNTRQTRMNGPYRLVRSPRQFRPKPGPRMSQGWQDEGTYSEDI